MMITASFSFVNVHVTASPASSPIFAVEPAVFVLAPPPTQLIPKRSKPLTAASVTVFAPSCAAGNENVLEFGKPGSPWNAAHASQGCSQANLVATGGAGLIYCFAEK